MSDDSHSGGMEFSDVGATSLMMLWCRAVESEAARPRLADPFAVRLASQLSPVLEGADSPLLRRLAAGRVHPKLQAYVAMRARFFDNCTRRFIARYPEGYVVNLGCGLDTRFHRVDDGSLRLFDLDRSDVIDVKRRLIGETDRYRFIDASVLEETWMEALPGPEVPVLFLAEGLLMYLPLGDIRVLVGRLTERFHTAELVAEVFNRRWLHPSVRWIVDRTLRKTLGFGCEARFRSGLENSDEMEGWGEGIEFLTDWSPFDEPGHGLGPVGVLGWTEFVRKTQWVVHYRIGSV